MAVEAGHGHEILIKDAIIFLVAAGVIVPVLKVLRLPGVVGFILAGIALGPHGFGQLSDRIGALEFITISEPDAAAPFAELGVLFLLFLLGLELSFRRLWELRRAVFGAGGVQAGLSALVVTGIGVALGLELTAAIVVGLALSLSSTAIVMQLLQESRRAASPVGRSAFAVLLFQDILVAPILILVGFLAMNGQSSLLALIGTAIVQGLLAIAVLVLIGRFLLARLFHVAARAGGRDFLMALILLTVVGAAAITASAGLSLALGAFLAGILLGETEFRHQTEIDLEPFKGLLLGLFFLTVGMSLDLGVILAEWPVVLAGVSVLIVLKFAISLVACRLFAGNLPVSLETASLLAGAGEFAFVILAASQAGNVVSPETASLVAAIAGLSMFLTPGLARLGQLAAKSLVADPEAPHVPGTFDAGDKEGHVIIAGFGRVGRTIADVLSGEGGQLVALDSDPRRVLREREKGWPVYFGDATRKEFLDRAGLSRAALVLVTVDDAANAEAIVRAVRQQSPAIPVFARAQDTDHAARLRKAGASFVIPDAIEAGLQLAGRSLVDVFGYGSETVRDLLAAEREGEYQKASER